MASPHSADWYGDPFGRHERRYWDGSRWTDHVVSGGHQSIDPLIGTSTAPVSHSSTPADWYPDPSGHHERRYWDGIQWTAHVSSSGHQMIDPLAPRAAPGVYSANRNVARQVRNAGADGRPVGGGTLFTEPVLVINQKAKIIGSTLEYAIYGQHGHPLGTVEEVRGLMARAGDNLRGRTADNRAYRLRILDVNRRVVLTMARPKHGWFSSKSNLIVEGPDGTPIGQITQETTGVLGSLATVAHAGLTSVSVIAGLGVGIVAGKTIGGAVGNVVGKTLGTAAGWVAGKTVAVAAWDATERSGVPDLLGSAVEGLDGVAHVRFGLEGGGQRLGSIQAESIKEWEFRVEDPSEAEIARITKVWAGWAKERFTRADNYVVQIHRHVDEPLRALLIAAAVALDIALKQGDPTSGTGRRRRYE